MSLLPCRSGLQPEQPGDPGGKRDLVALSIDPYRVHVYWTIEPPELQKDDPEPEGEAPGAGPVLRFHSIPHASLALEDSFECFDVPIELDAPNWYVQLPKPSGRYLVELGLRAKDGQFRVLARSALVQTPPASPSEKDDELLMLVMGDYLLPDPFPEHRGGQPAQELSFPLPAAVSEPSNRSGFNFVVPEAPVTPSPPERQPAILSSGKPDAMAHTEPGSHAGDTESKTAVKRHLVESDEKSFASGVSSILLGAGRNTC